MCRLVAVAVQMLTSSFSGPVRRTYFVAAQSWTCFLCKGTKKRGGGTAPLTNWSFSSSLAGLFPPGYPLPGSSLTMAAVRHPCMCSWGCAGYFNVGGLWRLGVSCVRASPPHQLYNRVTLLTCSLNPAGRYCAVDGCTFVWVIIQITNKEFTAACFYFEVNQPLSDYFPSKLTHFTKTSFFFKPAITGCYHETQQNKFRVQKDYR